MNHSTTISDEVIDSLSNLVEVNRDCQKCFQEAASKIDTPYIKSFCLEQSLSRAKFVDELQAQILSLGVEPEDTGSVAGALQRGWMNLKSALGGGDHAILAVTESGEDHAIKAYMKALEEALPEPVREMVERQLQGVKQSHLKVKELRDSLKK